MRLRPDILCERHDGRLVVLDTKWKRVDGLRDLSVADMHQMYAYGKRYRCKGEQMQHVVLLFPWHRGKERNLKPGLLPEGRRVSPDGVQVDMFFLDLSNKRATIDEFLRWAESLYPVGIAL